ncbi:MAG: BamA/TamA family outer membrane protein [Flavobacteriales bacterium]
MPRSHIRLLSIPIVISIAFQSCRPTRYVEGGQHLVVKNVVHLNENEVNETQVTDDDLYSVLKQKPNRKILGILNFHLGVWNYANGRNQEKKWNRFLKEDVGEAPILFEPVLLDKSREQIERYLQNHGHFDAKATAYAMLDEDEAELHYYVFTGPEYKLRKLGYSFEDDSLRLEFSNPENVELTKLKLPRGTVYNTDLLTSERNRLTKAIKDLGYYSFEKIHLLFDVDTNMEGTYYDVMVRFRNQRISGEVNGLDTIRIRPHQRHKISRVIINQNYEARSVALKLDSSYYRNAIYLYTGRPYVKPSRISRNLFLNKWDYYSLSKTQYTYDRLNALNNYRFIDIRFESVGEYEGVPQLDMYVNLTKAPKQAVTLETVGTNRSGNLGLSNSINYQNKNLFHGAEQFDWKIYGGVEWQKTNATVEGENEAIINKTPINTYEFGTQVGITIPDFLLRNPKRDLPRIKEPKTNISFALDRQGRPQYDRNLINLTYQWTMRLRPQDQLTIAPVDVSVIELQKDSTFQRQLLASKNSLLINSYNDHVIAAGRLSYSYSTQDLSNPNKNFYYYRVSYEMAGNLLRLGAGSIGLNKVDDSYIIHKVAFAQYVKADLEFKQYFILTESSKSVFRFFMGAGKPLTNLNALPFERSYFAGGSNGIRAWRARGLGPGNLADTAIYGIDQVGEFQMEINAEYRFKLFKQLEGALFSDFGNIWLLRYDPQRDGAEFNFKSFWRAIAVAPGAGIRYNLNFFVLRMDLGLQLKDPSLPQGERWAFFQPKTQTNAQRQEWRLNNGDPHFSDWKRPNVTLNLAIDYPF